MRSLNVRDASRKVRNEYSEVWVIELVLFGKRSLLEICVVFHLLDHRRAETRNRVNGFKTKHYD